MNTYEINRYLANYIQFFGTYPRDMLPRALARGGGIVVNTDKSTNPGLHWVAIYLSSDGYAVYFDSFGLPPMHIEIIKFLNDISPIGWFHNAITFQSLYTDTCGMYCVYFLANFFNGKDFELFRSIFNHSTKINDRLAKILYKYPDLLK